MAKASEKEARFDGEMAWWRIASSGADVGIRAGFSAMWWTVDWGKETKGVREVTIEVLRGVEMKLLRWREREGQLPRM